jgi:hypothetical protein
VCVGLCVREERLCNELNEGAMLVVVWELASGCSLTERNTCPVLHMTAL